MAQDLERADMAPSRLKEGGDASPISKKLLVLTKSRFSRISRLLVQVFIGIFLLLVLFNCIPAGTEAVLGPEYSRYWKWPYSSSSPVARFNVSEAGPVRMVVFGTPDVWTPSSTKGSAGPSWTMALCVQLGCTYHNSLIPSLDLPSQAVTSKERYEKDLEGVVSSNSSEERSGENYDFVQEQYPLSKPPDLAAQVDRFLIGEKPVQEPRETIWVFSLGTWDIWTLAALDRKLAQQMVESTIGHIFEQIEVLYKASLDPNSPAYSDYFAYAENPTSVLKDLNDNPLAKTAEAFRVIIPEVLDVSLTPGWQTLRPDPPQPHSKVEQMTRASFLTRLWNKQMRDQLHTWMQTPDPGVKFGPERPAERDDMSQPEHHGKPYFGFWDAEKKGPGSGYGEHDVLFAPYPRRLGMQANLTEFAMEAIVEKQMRDMGLHDAMGRGKADKGDAVRFSQVHVPCIWNGKTQVDGHRTACEDPKGHLFYAPFTMGERVIRETAKRTASRVMEVLYN